MNEWQNVYHKAPGYFLSISHENLIVRINDFFLNELGFSRDEVIGRLRVEELLTVGGKIFFQTHVYPLVKMKRSANEIYLSFLTKDKREIPVLLNISIEDFQENYEIHCIGLPISRRHNFEQELIEARKIAEKTLQENKEVINARTELERVKKALERQLRTLSQKNSHQIELNKVLSHDLQEPLRKIGIFSSMLSGQQDNLNDKVLETIDKIFESSSKVRELLDGLQRYNSLDSKNIELTEVDLSALIQKIKENFSGFPNLAIVFEDQTSVLDGWRYQGDNNLLSSFFRELLTYIIRYKKSQVDFLTIKISADIIKSNVYAETKDQYLYENCLRLTFSSDGENVFQSTPTFELFDRSQLLDEKMDISLAFCKKIVQMLNGTISTQAGKLYAIFGTIQQ